MKNINWPKSIKNYRDLKMLNQRTLGAMLGKHTNAISKWEKGYSIPQMRNRKRLSALPDWDDAVAYLEDIV